MRNKICLITFALSCLTLSLQAQTLQQDIDGLIEQTLPHANVGIFIKDAQSGKVLYQRNANKLFSPASNIKMLTAAAALYHLGPKDRYTTSLSRANNNVYITFSGSPALKTNDLKKLLQNVTTIKGNIVLDASQFKPPYYAAGTTYDDVGWYYNAPSSAIILNGNAMAYDFISAKTLGKLIEIKPAPSNKGLTIVNNVITVNKIQEKEHCNLNIQIEPNNTLRLYGCFSQQEKPQKMQLAIPNPALYAKQLIKSIVKENHISLGGKVVEGHKPPNATLIATHQSDELATLLKHMMLESDNLYADSVTKRLAHSLTGEGTYKQGAFAIKQILAKHTHLDIKQLELMDGVGTRYNMITPKQMGVFLTDIYQDKTIKPIFLNTLPQMGVSGTLKYRMKDTRLENNVLAKTGSMHDISALSGYLLLPNGRTIIFSIICNNLMESPKAKSLEDKILLATYAKLA